MKEEEKLRVVVVVDSGRYVAQVIPSDELVPYVASGDTEARARENLLLQLHHVCGRRGRLLRELRGQTAEGDVPEGAQQVVFDAGTGSLRTRP